MDQWVLHELFHSTTHTHTQSFPPRAPQQTSSHSTYSVSHTFFLSTRYWEPWPYGPLSRYKDAVWPNLNLLPYPRFSQTRSAFYQIT